MLLAQLSEGSASSYAWSQISRRSREAKASLDLIKKLTGKYRYQSWVFFGSFRKISTTLDKFVCKSSNFVLNSSWDNGFCLFSNSCIESRIMSQSPCKFLVSDGVSWLLYVSQATTVNDQVSSTVYLPRTCPRERPKSVSRTASCFPKYTLDSVQWEESKWLLGWICSLEILNFYFIRR